MNLKAHLSKMNFKRTNLMFFFLVYFFNVITYYIYTMNLVDSFLAYENLKK
jgi:hypothetical protein